MAASIKDNLIGRLNFVEGFEWVQKSVHENAKSKGFWDKERNDGEMIALMHSELSEALEALRKGNPYDDKVHHHKNSTVELADCVIRIMDFAASHNMDLASAILDKAAFNETRPHMHGKKF